MYIVLTIPEMFGVEGVNTFTELGHIGGLGSEPPWAAVTAARQLTTVAAARIIVAVAGTADLVAGVAESHASPGSGGPPAADGRTRTALT